jgi:hypothetical protein
MGGARRSLSEPQQSGTNGRSSKQVEVPEIRMSYRDKRGLSRILVLAMREPEAKEWHVALQRVVAAACTACSSSAYRTWAVSCMESACGIGQLGSIHRSKLRAIFARVSGMHKMLARAAPPA